MRLRYLLCVLAVFVSVAAAGETETQYYAVFMAGSKIGYGLQDRSVADGKVTSRQEMVLTITRGETAITIHQIGTAVETAAGKPLSFKQVQDMGIMVQTIEGTVDELGKLNVTITTGETTQKRSLDWPEGALLDEGLRLLSINKGLKEGTSYTAKLFDTSVLRTFDAEVRVGPTGPVDLLGRVVVLTEMNIILHAPTGAMTVTNYMDKDFKNYKTVMPMLGMNMEIIACDKQFALSENDVTDFFDKVVLRSPVSLAEAAAARAITYHLTPAKGAKLTIPATDNQTSQQDADGSFIVIVRPVLPPAGATFPYKGSDKTALAAMRPTRFLQCDSEEVVALARQAVGDTKDTAEAVKRIEAFVHEYIDEKSLSVGYATAVEVAISKQGDCTEHAVLAAAMCRAVGIPAQVVAGLAYGENFAGRKQMFWPHAWARGYVGGKWIGLDAALSGYDAGHIALNVGDGDISEFFGMVNTLGYFKITKVLVEK